MFLFLFFQGLWLPFKFLTQPISTWMILWISSSLLLHMPVLITITLTLQYRTSAARRRKWRETLQNTSILSRAEWVWLTGWGSCASHPTLHLAQTVWMCWLHWNCIKANTNTSGIWAGYPPVIRGGGGRIVTKRLLLTAKSRNWLSVSLLFLLLVYVDHYS